MSIRLWELFRLIIWRSRSREWRCDRRSRRRRRTFIRKITGDKVRYFEWMGAAVYTADHRAGAMHGKQFLLDSVYAGIDGTHVYGRVDFKDEVPSMDFVIVVNVESWASGEQRARRALRLDASISRGKLKDWKIENGAEARLLASSAVLEHGVKVALMRNFEFKAPLHWLLANPGPVSVGERKPGRGRGSGDQQIALTLQPVAKPSPGRRAAAGRMDGVEDSR